MKKTAKPIGRMLKMLRKDKKLTIYDVAERMNKTGATISNIENKGIHGLDVLSAYADAIGYDIDVRFTPKELNKKEGQ